MQSKWIGKSLTAWGGIVLLLPVLGQLFGIEVGNMDAIGAAGEAVINGVVVVGGFIMLLIGRLRANNGTPVRLKP